MTLSAADAPPITPSYRRWVLLLLMLIYLSNFIDRIIISVLGEAIKLDLKITDGQMGLLAGLAFAGSYGLLCLPIARLAERYRRTTVIAVAITVWSVFTALCGMAHSFGQLLLFRIGVGGGEAGYAPAAQSLISDYYPPEKRASALGVFALGVPLGTLLGALAGGYIAQHIDWRAAFLIVGAPGLVLAIVVKLFLREPRRGQSDPGAAFVPSGVVEAAPPLTAVLKALASSPAFLLMTAGLALVSLTSFGLTQFMAPFFIRVFGFDYTQAGMALGLLGGVSAALGTAAGGALTDRAGRKDRRWYALIGGIGALAAIPFYVIGFQQQSAAMALTVLFLGPIGLFCGQAPVYAFTHNLVAPRMRASATALVIVALTLVGAGLGPWLTGTVIDHVNASLFQSRFAGDFAAACPGGHAAVAAMADACRVTLAEGVRYSLMVMVSLLVLPALLFLLASRYVARDLDRAAALHTATNASMGNAQ
jgi:predicted MFS family arabinose efflux permease